MRDVVIHVPAHLDGFFAVESIGTGPDGLISPIESSIDLAGELKALSSFPLSYSTSE